MASYLLKNVTKSVWNITLSGKKVGTVVEILGGPNQGRFIGRIARTTTTPQVSAKEAFREAVRIENRISLCGRNDAEQAKKALEERNERVRQMVEEENAEFDKMFGDDPFIRQFMGRAKVRTTKISL